MERRVRADVSEAGVTGVVPLLILARRCFDSAKKLGIKVWVLH